MAITRQHYLIALAFLLALFALFAFMPFGSSPDPVAFQKTMDAGHAFAFILLSSLIYLAVEHHGKKWAVTVAAIVSIVLMVGIELVQPYVGRTASLADVEVGLLGMVIALSGMVVWRSSQRWLLRGAHLLLLVVSLVWIVQPALTEWRALWLRDQQFPLLGTFEDELEKRLWLASGALHEKQTQISFSQQYVGSGDHSLKVVTISGTWSGVRYAAGEQDWRGYRALSMTIYNPGAAFKLNIRIDDGITAAPAYSERYNGRVAVNNGVNTVLLPLDEIAAGPKSRSLELSSIRKMVLFVNQQQQTHLFYLDDIRLVP